MLHLAERGPAYTDSLVFECTLASEAGRNNTKTSVILGRFALLFSRITIAGRCGGRGGRGGESSGLKRRRHKLTWAATFWLLTL